MYSAESYPCHVYMYMYIYGGLVCVCVCMCDNESVCVYVPMGGMHKTTPVVPDSSLGIILHHIFMYIRMYHCPVHQCVSVW